MFINNTFDDENSFVLSYELLALLIWILENEDAALANLIKKAVRSGLKQELYFNGSMLKDELIETARETVIDFFGVMESHLAESLKEQDFKKATVQHLLPAIDHLDAKTFDPDTVRLCLAKATSLPKDSKHTPKETLYKELLKNWNPITNPEIN